MAKPGPEEALAMLRSGNERFRTNSAMYPNTAKARLQLASCSDQADYAYATILSCSDSRVPVELIFDAGVMDLFVIRVAGNVCGEDEMATIEYGLAHVKTPVLVVLGHTQCGAVTVATQVAFGAKPRLERHIPRLIEKVLPAVEMARSNHPGMEADQIIPQAIQENVLQGIWSVFTQSAAVRQLVKAGSVRVVGAIYDLSSGSVDWLPQSSIVHLLAEADASPDSAIAPYADA
jgi:carbonic anhydrase